MEAGKMGMGKMGMEKMKMEEMETDEMEMGGSSQTKACMQMMGEMETTDAALDELVGRMQAAEGAERMAAMEEVSTEMVAQWTGDAQADAEHAEDDVWRNDANDDAVGPRPRGRRILQTPVAEHRSLART